MGHVHARRIVQGVLGIGAYRTTRGRKFRKFFRAIWHKKLQFNTRTIVPPPNCGCDNLRCAMARVKRDNLEGTT